MSIYDNFIVVGPVIGLIVAIFPIRLIYLEKQYENLAGFFKKEKENADGELQKEINKKKPSKELVLSFATRITTLKHREHELREWADGSRKNVFLDLITLGILFAIGFLGLVNFNTVNALFVILIPLAFLTVMISVWSFGSGIYNIHVIKRKIAKEENHSST